MDSLPVALPLPRRGFFALLIAAGVGLGLGAATAPGEEDYAVYSAVLRDHPCEAGCILPLPAIFTVAPWTLETHLPARLQPRFGPSPQVILDLTGEGRRTFYSAYRPMMDSSIVIPPLIAFGRVRYGSDRNTAQVIVDMRPFPARGVLFEARLVKEGGRWRTIEADHISRRCR